MDLVELTKTVINSIIIDTENLSVEEINSDDKTIEILVKISESDMGRVIGREGKVINAIRTLIQEASFLRENKYIKIEVEAIKNENN